MKINKYYNRKVIIDGFKFDSQKEAKRYNELKLMEREGIIHSLRLQPRFLLQDKFQYKNKTYRKIEYIADFSYFNTNEDVLVIEDAKGFKTEVFKLKEKLLIKSLIEQDKKFEFRIM